MYRLGCLLIRWGISLTGGGDTMLAVYVMMIHKGLIKFEQVPPGSQEQVAEALAVAELDQNGNVM